MAAASDRLSSTFLCVERCGANFRITRMKTELGKHCAPPSDLPLVTDPRPSYAAIKRHVEQLRERGVPVTTVVFEYNLTAPGAVWQCVYVGRAANADKFHKIWLDGVFHPERKWADEVTADEWKKWTVDF